jgi:peptide/nickel transport system ATP-binding protein/oligopeptide transport system ATP-binding protein
MTEPLLSVRGLSKSYAAPGGAVRALDRVSFELARGETLGVVGESGCGKSTLGRSLLRLIEPSGGAVLHRGVDIARLSPAELQRRRRHLQIIFQDPFGSLNPRHRVRAILAEPLEIHGVGNRATRRAKVAELLDIVGLGAAAADLYPHEFSGGQRQRVAIARAIALEPELVVADEPVSALDVSIQAQILNLLAELKTRLHLTMLFISHDLGVIRQVSDRVAVMYLGRIVELSTVDALFDRPAHPYSAALLSAIPRPVPGRRRDRVLLQGDLPDPAHPPQGCTFHTRCPQAMARCAVESPDLVPRRVGDVVRLAACHLHIPDLSSPELSRPDLSSPGTRS